MRPVQVDVITPLPEGWGLCVTCESFMDQAGLGQVPFERSLESFPPDWQEEFIRLSDFVQKVSQEYGDQILIRLYDPRSMQGLAKAIRNGIRKYPTFLVEGKTKISGLKPELLDQAIRAVQGRADIQYGND
jgi:hypothetical protein